MKKLVVLMIALCLVFFVGQAVAKKKPSNDLSQATVAEWMKAKKNKKLKAAVKWVEATWMPSAGSSDFGDTEADEYKGKKKQREKPKQEDKRVKKTKTDKEKSKEEKERDKKEEEKRKKEKKEKNKQDNKKEKKEEKEKNKRDKEKIKKIIKVRAENLVKCIDEIATTKSGIQDEAVETLAGICILHLQRQ